LHFFFFNDTATTEIYTLSLHDALPIWFVGSSRSRTMNSTACSMTCNWASSDRKSTRLNSSHRCISYAVFCLTKKHVAFRKILGQDVQEVMYAGAFVRRWA